MKTKTTSVEIKASSNTGLVNTWGKGVAEDHPYHKTLLSHGFNFSSRFRRNADLYIYTDGKQCIKISWTGEWWVECGWNEHKLTPNPWSLVKWHGRNLDALTDTLKGTRRKLTQTDVLTIVSEQLESYEKSYERKGSYYVARPEYFGTTEHIALVEDPGNRAEFMRRLERVMVPKR